MATKPPPTTLSKAAATLWSRYCTEYALTDVATLTMLEAALNAWDRARQAEAVLRKEGVIVKSRTGFQRPHAAVGIARDANAFFLKAMRNLDLLGAAAEPAPLKGRPAYMPTSTALFKKLGTPNAH